MSKRVLILALPMLAAAIAMAMAGDIPIEIMTQDSDMVVVGTIAEVGASEKVELEGAEKPRFCDGYYQKYVVSVDQVLAWPKPMPSPKQLERITVYACGPRPGPPPTFVDMPGEDYSFTRWEDFLPTFEKGQSRVLLLKKIPNASAYYVRLDRKAYPTSNAATVERYRRACEPDKWPWGEPVDGLQLALLIRYPEVTGDERGIVHVRSVVAIRNVSKESIRLALYPPDRFLSFVAAGPQMERLDVPSQGDEKYGVPFESHHLVTLGPRQVLFIWRYGTSYLGEYFEQKLAPGPWEITARLEVKRTILGERLWTGRIISQPMPLRVLPETARPPRRE